MSDAVWRSRAWRAPSTGVVVATLVILSMLLTGCTDGSATPTASEAGPITDVVPEIPGVSEPATAESTAPADTQAPPAPQPRAGGHVLVDLEGLVTNRDAADVVIRTERGAELDRFRFAGAIAVTAEQDGRWALVNTLDGRWAVLDGVEGTLALLTFPGPPPRTPPVIAGSVAWWNDPAAPWLVRLDGGVPIDIAARLGEYAEVHSATADSSHVLAVGARTYIIDTSSGDARALEQTTFVALGPEGRVLVVTPSETGGALLTVEAVDGSDRRDLALLATPGQPIPLVDGRVLVAGASTAIVSPDGSQTALPAIVGIEDDPVVSPAGRVVLVPSADGLVLVDLAAGTVSVVPDSIGYTRPAGTGRWLWSVSSAPAEGGALVIDTETATVSPLLADTATSAIDSVTTDGALAAVRTGPGGTEAVIVGTDGRLQEIVVDARVVDVGLHPSGAFSAAALVMDTTRLLLIREGSTQRAQVDTGRSPVWLRTTE